MDEDVEQAQWAQLEQEQALLRADAEAYEQWLALIAASAVNERKIDHADYSY